MPNGTTLQPHLPGVTHRFVDAGGLKMHVAEAGDPGAPPLLMLHGWPQNWYAFRHLITGLATEYRVVAPDLRGWGETEAPATGYRTAQRAADVVALIEALDLARDHKIRLIGHDWGCWVGFLLCVERPELIDRYLALSLFHLWPKAGVKQALAMRRFWYWPVVASPRLGPAVVRSRRFRKAIYRIWAAPGAHWSDTDFDALTAHLEEPARALASSLSYRAALAELAPAVAGRFRHSSTTTPVLFLHGAVDGCIDPALVTPTRRAPNMTIEILPGVGHFPAEEVPELVLQRASAFFA
jgi:pimeloyl-ACP methyl ester carboxylesterase